MIIILFNRENYLSCNVINERVNVILHKYDT